ncbi:MAG: MBL fold metallo-hydrolase [Trueperaceae bacterium]
MQLHLIRNATLRLNYAGRLILVDPFLAERHSLPPYVGIEKNPTVDLPCSAKEVIAGAELVLISHLHADHFDGVAQQLLPKSLPIICQPGDETVIRNFGFQNVSPLIEIRQWQGVQITPASGQHGSGPILERMGTATGFVLQAPNEPTIYLASDTILCPPVLVTIEQTKPQVIITNSGGAKLANTTIIMDVEQTLKVCQAAPQSTIIATHLETLDLLTVSRAMLREAAERAGIPSKRLIIPQDGETVVIGLD